MPRHKQSDPTSIKTQVIRLRVTEAEKFRSRAAESGYKTVSEYIRSRCIADDSSSADNNAVKQSSEV